MPHRDPETGQFLSHDETKRDFKDITVQRQTDHFSVAAADLDGSTGQQGGQHFVATSDLDIDIAGGLDRNEVAKLLATRLTVQAFVNSTATADGTVEAELEYSTEAAPEIIEQRGEGTIATAGLEGGAVDRLHSEVTNSPEVLAWARAVGHNPFSDGASGVGGGGSAGETTYVMEYGELLGEAAPEFDRHSDIHTHVALRNWNMADAAIHATGNLDLVWGIFEDC